MNNALIGYTGFVGGLLQKQTNFQHLYRSTNIKEIEGKNFDTVVCAGAPAQKWIANQKPQEDENNINQLIHSLQKVKAKNFILISTVDVFKDPTGVNENTEIDEDGLHAYGLNRRALEKFVEKNFNHLIVRLPGLVGPGLRKNIIYDFLNDNNVSQIESRNIFQFYPMVNLWSDINICLKNKLNLVHLTSQPISVAEVATEGFNLTFENHLNKPLVNYDFRSAHAAIFDSILDGYQYSKRETLIAIRAYAQSEVAKAKV